MIIDSDNDVQFSFHRGLNQEKIEQKILSEPKFNSTIHINKKIVKEMILPSLTDDNVMEKYLVLMYPYYEENGTIQSIVMYQSLRRCTPYDEKNDEYCYYICIHCIHFNDNLRIFPLHENHFTITRNEASCV